MHSRLLTDLAVAAIAATVLGLFAHRLRQPVILGYLVAGALVGPQLGFAWINDQGSIETISQIGLILLLFIVGLEMNLAELGRSGRRIVITGVGQVALCGLTGGALFLGLGALGVLPGGFLTAGYLASGCALSSTAIVIKLLHDNHEIDTRHGRVVLGVLVIQDLVAIVLLAFQPHLAEPQVLPVARALAFSAVLFALAFLVSRFVLSRIFAWIDRTPELVVATSLAWCAAVAGAAGALGLSVEMGALVAGMAVSAFPFSAHVSVKVTPLRDFFLTLFFIAVGMRISAPTLAMLWQVPVLVLFTALSRFATVYPLLIWQGASRRTAFLSSLQLGQISEFSLVLAAVGATAYHHIDQATVDLLVYAMAVAAVLSSYAIAAQHALHRVYDDFVTRLGRPDTAGARSTFLRLNDHDIVILGFHRGARALIEHIQASRPALLPRTTVVDFNLDTLEELKRLGVNPRFGDLASIDAIAPVLEGAKLIISTIPDVLLRGTNNLALTRACRTHGGAAVIIAIAETADQESRLRDAGASVVLRPYSLLGSQVAQVIEESGVV